MAEDKRRSILLRVNEQTWRNVKKLSFLTERSINDIAVEAITNTIETQKKMLTNADIVLS